MNRILLFFAALLLLLIGGTILWYSTNNAATAVGSMVEADPDFKPIPKELDGFEFTDQLAQPFGSKDLEGKVWMASFFFASCPSICAQQNAEISKIHKRFKDDDVTILNISVQPDVDEPHVLLLYANRFEADHSKWKFLTGKGIDYVRQVGAEFFSLPAADETHTSDLALFDHTGQMYGPYKVTDAREQTKLIVKTEELLANYKASLEEGTQEESSSDSSTSKSVDTQEVSEEEAKEEPATVSQES